MEEKRDEVYERIPWETLEKPGGDRQWVVLGVAAAIVAGALGYTFVSSRAAQPEMPVASVPVAAADSPQLPASPAPIPAAVPPATTLPTVIAEADLYAVPPQRLADAAGAHAEFFVVEYLTVDGTGQEPALLRSLLPTDVPLPAAPEGLVVFVEWVGAIETAEIGVGRFQVDVLARYMVAQDGAPYQRAQPEVLSVEVEVDDSGARVASAPVISSPPTNTPMPMGIVDLPPEIAASVATQRPDAEVVGGVSKADGSWQVLLLAKTAAGITRPESLRIFP